MSDWHSFADPKHDVLPCDTMTDDPISPPPKPCLRRLDPDGWCLLADRHDGECIGYPNQQPMEPSEFGPDATKRRRF